MCLCFKTSPCAKHFIWKLVWFTWKWTVGEHTSLHEWFHTKTRFDTEVEASQRWPIVLIKATKQWQNKSKPRIIAKFKIEELSCMELLDYSPRNRFFSAVSITTFGISSFWPGCCSWHGMFTFTKRVPMPKTIISIKANFIADLLINLQRILKFDWYSWTATEKT